MISTSFLIGAAVLLAAALIAARRSRGHQTRLERDNHDMQLELERNRQTARSILRELQNP